MTATMSGFVPLQKPPAPSGQPSASFQVSFDELKYPTFRLLNRQNRIQLSNSPFELDIQHTYRLFVTANSKGWFAAVVSNNGAFSLICAPLTVLREAASKGSPNPPTISRTVELGLVQPRILSLACNDTRLLVSFASGELRMYDTSHIFSPGSGHVDPSGYFQASGGSMVRHIAPNPNSADGTLASLVAVLYEDSRVAIYNVLNAQCSGGWLPTEFARPVVLVWSPKGKQLALGLQTGDILTFSLSDMAAPQKHIPPTASATLASLDWLSPGFTFKTTYSSEDPQHHIVVFHHQTSVTTFVNLTHPFPLPDRPQNGLTIILPSWNLTPTDSVTHSVDDTNKALLIVADICSTDIEILGVHGAKWDQRSRDDNTVSIPLDQNYEDTTVLALCVDLTSTTSVSSTLPSGEATEWPAAPILYAYLNDGTIQAWHIAQETAYSGMMPPTNAIPSPLGFQHRQMSITADAGPSEMTMHLEPTTPQPSLQPSTAEPSKLAQSPFNRHSPSFNSLAQSPAPTAQVAFEQPSTPGLPSVFGHGAFGTLSASSSGLTSSNESGNSNSGSGLIKPATGFGAFGNFGQSKFTSNAFGQASFGQSAFEQTPSTNDTTQKHLFAARDVNKPSFPQNTSFDQPPFGKSAFGQPAFGQPTFGKSGTSKIPPSMPATTPASGGFSAFAIGGASAFGSTTQSLKTPSAPDGNGQSPNSSTPNDSLFPTKPAFAFVSPSYPTLSKPGDPRPPLGSHTSPDPPEVQKRSEPPSPSRESPTLVPSKAHVSVFSQPQPSGSAIKLSAGFGAFGSDSLPTTSPFFSANKASPLAPTFGDINPSLIKTSPGTATSTPTFGATSSLGFTKPAFASLSSSPSDPPKAHGISTNPFGAFAGPRKSFKDLLHSGVSIPDPEKSKVSVFSNELPPQTLSPPAETIGHPDRAIEGDRKKYHSSDKEITLASTTNDTMEGTGQITRPNSTPSAPTSDAPSCSSVSLSSLMSFVDVTDASDDDHDHDQAGSEPEDDEAAFLSEPETDDSNEDSSFIPEDALITLSGEPSAPSAATRSPSMTPKAQPLSELISKSPSPKEEASGYSHPESTTTPPGSPERIKSASPLPAPAPVLASFPVSVSLGTGRPNTRPARSSPLAKTPLSGDDGLDREDLKSTLEPVPLKPRLGAFGVFPPTPKIDLNKDTAGKLGRPNTPPLLFALGSSLSALPADTADAPVDVAERPPPNKELNMNMFGDILPPALHMPVKKDSPVFPSSPVFHGAPSSFSADRKQIPTTVTSTSLGPPVISAPTQARTLTDLYPGDTPSQDQASLYKLENKPPVPSLLNNTSSSAITHLKEPTVGEGMQAECAFLFASLAKELEDLKALAAKNAEELKKSTWAGKINLEEKLGVGQVHEFGDVLKSLAPGLAELRTRREAQQRAIHDVQGGLLKAGTRMEEIDRFNSAKNDAEFARMLKSRTLGPEHYETQTQLRKGIQIMQDRIVKLETHLTLSKKKLKDATSGKPVIRAPSLVTVNRTLKNIDIAIAQLGKDISSLSLRTSELTPEVDLSATLGNRSNHPTMKRLFNVTPHVAITTAAALNAERSAQKLKKRLLLVRRQPLLNTKATVCPTVPIAFTANKATSRDVMDLAGHTPLLGLPADFDMTPSIPSRRGATFTSKRPKSVPLKKSQGETTSPVPSFDWGPLPTFPPLQSAATPIIIPKRKAEN